MSRQNKVNKDHYTMAGRLTPDDLARERLRQKAGQHQGGRRVRNKPMAPWMANEGAQGGTTLPEDEAPAVVETPEASDTAPAAAETQPQGMPRRQAANKKGAPAARKRNRVTPRRKITGEAPATARRKSTKASGARGTPKTRKAPSARGTAARGASPQRAGRPAAGRGRTKGHGRTRKTQKKR